MRGRNESGGCNRRGFNLEMEWLGYGLGYLWLKSVKEARCYGCRYT